MLCSAAHHSDCLRSDSAAGDPLPLRVGNERHALYQPLEAGDFDRISAILSSGYRVFRRIAGICTVYILLLTAVFPAAAGVPSSAWFILVLGLGTVIHYLFGKPESLLIVSDQKGYVLYGLGTAATLLSTAVQVALIRGGNPLILVRLAGTLLSIGPIAPVLLYARRHYRISVKVRYTEEPIPQKWNGIAQHVAYFILENTDVILLSLFTAFREVSVYSVYFMVISGVRRIFTSVTYNASLSVLYCTHMSCNHERSNGT